MNQHQSIFNPRQYMISRDYEIYYYCDTKTKPPAAHSHDYYEFYFFLSGHVSIHIHNQEYPLNKGDMILIPPGVTHHVELKEQSVPYKRFVFWISKNYCEGLMKESVEYGYLLQLASIQKRYIYHFDVVAFNRIQSKIFRLIEELRGNRFGKELQSMLCANDLIFDLNRTIHETEHAELSKERRSLYQNLLLYIEEHIDEDLSLDSLSGIFFVSKYHIAHVFKEHTGLSLHQYIIKKRLSMCRQAILTDSEIAESCLRFGFKDYTSFYRAFCKEYGMSPREYQKQHAITDTRHFVD